MEPISVGLAIGEAANHSPTFEIGWNWIFTFRILRDAFYVQELSIKPNTNLTKFAYSQHPSPRHVFHMVAYTHKSHVLIVKRVLSILLGIITIDDTSAISEWELGMNPDILKWKLINSENLIGKLHTQYMVMRNINGILKFQCRREFRL